VRKVLEDLIPRRRNRNPLEIEERRATTPKKPKAS
jgi:hypothetical protein